MEYLVCVWIRPTGMAVDEAVNLGVRPVHLERMGALKIVEANIVTKLP